MATLSKASIASAPGCVAMTEPEGWKRNISVVLKALLSYSSKKMEAYCSDSAARKPVMIPSLFLAIEESLTIVDFSEISATCVAGCAVGCVAWCVAGRVVGRVVGVVCGPGTLPSPASAC